MNCTPVVGRKEFGSAIGYADSGRVAWIFAMSFVYRRDMARKIGFISIFE